MCADGDSSVRRAQVMATLSLSGRPAPRRRTTATSRRRSSGRGCASSCSSYAFRTPMRATPLPACPSAPSACARAWPRSSDGSGALRASSCSTTPPRRAAACAARSRSHSCSRCSAPTTAWAVATAIRTRATRRGRSRAPWASSGETCSCPSPRSARSAS